MSMHDHRWGAKRDADFTDTVAIVTGGGHGIGAVIARRLATAGAHVALLGRDEVKLDATRRAIVDAGGHAMAVPADVSAEDAVTEAFADVGAALGAPTILINNAGISGPSLPLAELSLDAWQSVMNINLTGVFLCCRAAIPGMRLAGGGRIVTIGSVTGKRPLANRTPYAAAKMGLIGMSRSLAHEVATHEITVNTICPFLVAGPRLESVIASMASERGISHEELRAELTADSPFGRPVTEDDVADLALFLSSAAARNLTGQDFNVSAGSVTY